MNTTLSWLIVYGMIMFPGLNSTTKWLISLNFNLNFIYGAILCVCVDSYSISKINVKYTEKTFKVIKSCYIYLKTFEWSNWYFHHFWAGHMWNRWPIYFLNEMWPNMLFWNVGQLKQVWLDKTLECWKLCVCVLKCFLINLKQHNMLQCYLRFNAWYEYQI